MKNLQTFAEFLNENLNESFASDKITNDLWKPVLKKFEKYVVYDNHNRGTLPIDDNKLGALLEEAILKEIKGKGLTLVKGFSDTPTANAGYAGKSTTWKKMVQDENGSKMNIDLVTNTDYHYMYASIPFRKLTVVLYGNVTINHRSTAVGGGVKSDKMKMSYEEQDDMTVNITKYIIKNFESIIRK